MSGSLARRSALGLSAVAIGVLESPAPSIPRLIDSRMDLETLLGCA